MMECYRFLIYIIIYYYYFKYYILKNKNRESIKIQKRLPAKKKIQKRLSRI
jgi:hypothetical protein